MHTACTLLCAGGIIAAFVLRRGRGLRSVGDVAQAARIAASARRDVDDDILVTL